MELKKALKEKVNLVDKALDTFLPKEEEYPPILYKAMRYSIFAGGKRLRPAYLLGAYEIFKEDTKKALPFACAIEMIHTYSLIHDDLPAMDNDDYRRGRLTSHKVFGEDMAILAGDALLSHAFEILSDAVAESGTKEAAKAMRAIAKGAGVFGMIGGQVADVTGSGTALTKDTLDYIYEKKTAAMIIGALKAGAYLGGAAEEEVKKFETAGEKIGVAFQIQDDILDVTSTTEVLGKPVLSDEKNHKVTYVTLFGIEKCMELVEQYSKEAIEILEGFGEKGTFAAALTKYLIQRVY